MRYCAAQLTRPVITRLLSEAEVPAHGIGRIYLATAAEALTQSGPSRSSCLDGRLCELPWRLYPAKAGVVGLGRFELPTSRLSSARSNQLSYRPRAHARPAQLERIAGKRMLQRS